MRLPALTLLYSTLFVSAASMFALDTSRFHDNQDRTLQCEDHNGNWGQSRFCEMREQTIPGSGSLHIDALTNGGVTVKGWNRSDVLVRSRVESWAPSREEARSLASAVTVHAAPGDIRANGPQTADHRGWSVSYEVFLPHLTDLTARAHNGGMSAADIGGKLDLQTTNGGLSLARVTGDVTGVTVNGGVHVDLLGDHWDGRGLELSSTNGGVHIGVPPNYSAHLESSTVNGGIHNELAAASDASPKHGTRNTLSTDLGNGGATLHVTTVNGGVSIGRHVDSNDM